MKLFTTVKATLTKFAPIVAAAAAQTPKPDEEGFKTWVKTYADPAMNTLLWVIPLGFGIFALTLTVRWYFASESKREELQITDKIRTGLYILIGAESITVLLKLIGFAI